MHRCRHMAVSSNKKQGDMEARSGTICKQTHTPETKYERIHAQYKYLCSSP